MNVFTVGFTNKSASHFFKLLKDADVKTLLDVRLNNTSQLSGFAKREDLRFFLRELIGTNYLELKDLAPSKHILSCYQKGDLDWKTYEKLYINEISKRCVERLLDPDIFDQACLLCSEHEPHFCHRRLAVEYLNTCWDSRFSVKHLY